MELKTFRFWCQKVLPLVYDDSLSYYEILCKVVNYLNNMIGDVNSVTSELAELRKELDVVNKWIKDFDPDVIAYLVDKYIATMIFVEISDSGYFVYYVPDSWDDIKFNTTGLDISVPDVQEYGRLVLSY